jgi:TetR/AcrR family transcriptional regulator
MPRPRSDIRQRIIRSARKRFLDAGVDGASLRTIARGARTSIGMVYYYFPTKDELFLAVVEAVYAGLLADLEVALDAAQPPRDRIRRLYTRIGAVSQEELDTIRLIAREALSSAPRLAQIIARFQRGHMPLVLRALGDGMADGAIDVNLHPALVFFATLGLGLLPQLLPRVIGPRLPFAALPAGEQLSAALTDVLFVGIGPGKVA